MSGVCTTCKFAQWELTPKGKPRKNIPGRCLVPVELPVLPACAMPIAVHKQGIWHDFPTACPTWAAK